MEQCWSGWPFHVDSQAQRGSLHLGPENMGAGGPGGGLGGSFGPWRFAGKLKFAFPTGKGFGEGAGGAGKGFGEGAGGTPA